MLNSLFSCRSAFHAKVRLPLLSSTRWSASRSSSSAAATAARDTRLAGRRRFYREVTVAKANPASLLSLAAVQPDDPDSVESPISVGTDGTDSASGVVRTTSGRSFVERERLLLPTPPGQASSSASASDFAWYNVQLDGRALKTPLGFPLAVPSQVLAHAIAAEWDMQSPTLVPAQMPLTTLTCTAIDQTSQQPDAYRQEILKYLQTDTISYMADPMEDRLLHSKQQQAFEPILAVLEHMTGKRPATVYPSDGILGGGGRKLPHPTPFRDYGLEWTMNLDAWHLTAVHSIAAEAKSFSMAVALVGSRQQQSDGTVATLSPLQVMEAARVEEEFQIGNWGLVEGGHDYDRLNCSVQLHAATMVVECLALAGIKSDAT